jgi:uncharacterized protein (DUF1501 family)
MLPNLDRRGFLTSAAVGATLCGWLGRVAAQAPEGGRAKSCILLWMAGGPSHIDTFDPKPDAPEHIRGEFRPITTSVPGIRISEHFPRFANLMHHAAILRGMSTLESDHKLATYHLHTGYQNRAGVVSFPSMGAIVSKELGKRDVPLPNFVCIGNGPQQATRSGFLGPAHQPLPVSEPLLGLDFIEPAAPRAESARQLSLLRRLEQGSRNKHNSAAAEAHAFAVDQAVRLMSSQQKRAFNLALEKDAVRDAYGLAGSATGGRFKGDSGSRNGSTRWSSFGQGCLMARRLVEVGVPFVEVVLDGWDTHRDNFPRTRALSLECDTAMAALIEDLQHRGLLDSTLVVWMGEFGRTPQCSGGGRNHWSRAWSSVLVGGGINGGQVVGRTDRDGAAVVDRPISVTDFLGTVCTILGIDYTQNNHPPGVDRPIPIVDTSKEVNILSELL